MPATDTDARAPRPVDDQALARWRSRLRDAAEPPWLHAEAARRMADRLGVVRMQPQAVLDWGLQAAHDRPLLAAAYPRARLLAVDPDGLAPATAATPRAWWRGMLGRERGPARASPADLAPASAQLVWSVMALHTMAEPLVLFRAWHRALAVDGFLMFCTVGPGTLLSLSSLYAAEGWPPPLAPLVDMHDLGDMLVQAGFADPVMDQETVRLTWSDGPSALRELQGLGLNASPRRPAGLRTPRWRRRLVQGLERQRTADGRIALEFEIVYGHAFKPAPRLRVAAETNVALEDLRTMARRGSETRRR